MRLTHDVNTILVAKIAMESSGRLLLVLLVLGSFLNEASAQSCVSVSTFQQFKTAIRNTGQAITFCPFSIFKPDADFLLIDSPKSLTCLEAKRCTVRGGGVHIRVSGSPSKLNVSGFRFSDATASAIRIESSSSTNTHRIHNCAFWRNRRLDTNGGGGAIRVQTGTKLSIFSTRFQDNEAKEGGAIYHAGSELYVENTIFKENVAQQGGGIFIHSSSSSLELKSTKFFSNIATTDASGAISAESVRNLNRIANRQSSDNGCEGIFESSIEVCHLFTGGVTGCVPDGNFCRTSIGCCAGLQCVLDNSAGGEICTDLSYTPPTLGSYHGTDCNVKGPAPTTMTTVTKFLVFGDTPYDHEVGPPFEGPEYDCMKTVALPGVKQLAGSVDFIAHVGDIKRGGSGYSSFCNDQVYSSRRDLFEIVESHMDFLMVVGDNEWNECDGYNMHPDVDDSAKTLWREYFTTGKFEGFDHPFPYGGEVQLERQPGKPENFFFYYEEQQIAFLGITEPMGDTRYNAINAGWVEEKLSGKTPQAVVVFGHDSRLSNEVRSKLSEDTPTLYVAGNVHKYCMKFLDHDNLLQLTVDPFLAAPLLVSIVKDDLHNHFFHVDATPYGCE
eukprot:scaffold630_cov174-Amphora_coffeaeformis.AAC.21